MCLGAVRTRAVQRIYELDSGKSKGLLTFHQTIEKFHYNEISNILYDLAIIFRTKHEKLKLLEGVLSGIPNECLATTVSNSSRVPIHRFAMEVEAVRQLGRFMDKRMIIVHEQDSGFAEVLKKKLATTDPRLSGRHHGRQGRRHGYGPPNSQGVPQGPSCLYRR